MKNAIVIGGLVILVMVALWFLWPENNDVQNVVNQQDSEEIESMESVNEMETGTYTADTNDSVVAWQAGKPAISGYVHTGTFSLQSGEVDLSGESLTGEFILDMDSVKVTSLGGGKAGQESLLESHLKAGGFFDVETYPTAIFTITDVSPKILPGPSQSEYTATGELTLKGVTNEVSFPMRVIVGEGSEVWMFASLSLDRTLWGISTMSATIAERITDNIIGDEVEIDIEMRLVK